MIVKLKLRPGKAYAILRSCATDNAEPEKFARLCSSFALHRLNLPARRLRGHTGQSSGAIKITIKATRIVRGAPTRKKSANS